MDGKVNLDNQLDYPKTFVLISFTGMPIGDITLKLLFRRVRKKSDARRPRIDASIQSSYTRGSLH